MLLAKRSDETFERAHVWFRTPEPTSNSYDFSPLENHSEWSNTTIVLQKQMYTVIWFHWMRDLFQLDFIYRIRSTLYDKQIKNDGQSEQTFTFIISFCSHTHLPEHWASLPDVVLYSFFYYLFLTLADICSASIKAFSVQRQSLWV